MNQNAVMLSVVMAVYNGEEYIYQAIKSVLNQTYQNFEFIIVDDASTDGTVRVIESVKDSRIQLIRNERNLRLGESLNKGIKAAKGKYIVRVDADDICFANRFEVQVAYMEKHPQVGVACGNVIKFSDERIRWEIDSNEKNAEYIRTNMIFFNTVYHNNSIIRREIFDEYSYRKEYTVTEDMDLWLRVSEKYRIARMCEYTLLYRFHNSQASTGSVDTQRLQEKQMKIPYLERLLGGISDAEQDLHARISWRRDSVQQEELFSWIRKLWQGNQIRKVYDEKVFKNVLIRVGILVSGYNGYVIKGISGFAKEFGFFAVMMVLFRIFKNVVIEAVRFLFAVNKGRRYLR